MPPKKGRPGRKIFWSEEGRLESFVNWPLPDDADCTPAKMAAAGFYMNGSVDSNDNVSCFMCGKSLDGWENDDDPMAEHSTHCPTCPFMNLHLEENRAKTYKFWPHKKYPKKAQDFAEAGFVHAPTSDSWDNVRCFSCDKNLGGWEANDDPLVEHQTRSNCSFIQATNANKVAAVEEVEEVEESEAEVSTNSSESESNDTTDSMDTTATTAKAIVNVAAVIDPQPVAIGKTEVASIEMEVDEDMSVEEYLKAQCDIKVLQLVQSCETRIDEFKTTALQFRTQIAA